MVFGNVFDFADKGAKIFSVNRGATRPRPGQDVDFEDAEDDTYDDTSASLFTSAIHGASSGAKVVQEQCPEARIILGFLGAFIDNTQASVDKQSKYAADPGSVSQAASAGMEESSRTVTEHEGLQKDDDLKNPPKKSDYTKAPKAPKTTAETPSRASASDK